MAAHLLAVLAAQVRFPSLALAKKVGKNSNVFSPSRHKVVDHKNGTRHDNKCDLASPLSSYRYILILATPSMCKHSVSARNGKKLSVRVAIFLFHDLIKWFKPVTTPAIV